MASMHDSMHELTCVFFNVLSSTINYTIISKLKKRRSKGQLTNLELSLSSRIITFFYASHSEYNIYVITMLEQNQH